MERDGRTIRRETQKFKRFYEETSTKRSPDFPRPEDDWEESSRHTDMNQRGGAATKQAARDTSSNRPPQNNSTGAGSDVVPETSSATATTNAPSNQAGTAADSAHAPVPEQDSDSQEADHEVLQKEADNQNSPDSRRTSNRKRRPRDMYGDWDTSNRRRGYNRR